MKQQRALLITLMSFCLVSVVNCGGVHFDNGGGDSSSGSPQTATSPGGSGGDVSNAGGPAGPINGVGNSSSAILPKVQFIGPPCQRMSNCSVTFQLDKAYAARVEFDWKTRDDLYGKPADPNAFPWGQPDVQYVRTSGHVVFAPGETSQTVYIRNINPQYTDISIGVEMSVCSYDSLLESCLKFFN